MGSAIRGMPGGAPLTVNPRLLGGIAFQPRIFVTGPAGDVQGFAFDGVEQEPTQAEADSLSEKLGAFYASLDSGERTIMAALLAQASDYVEQMWPEEYAEATAG
jgi:hypothetical protein